MRKKRKKRGESSGRSRRVGRRKMGATGSEVNVKNRLPQMLSLTLSNSDRCLLFLYYNSPLLSLPFTMFHSSAPILSWIYSIYVVASPFHQNVSFEVIDDLHLTKSDGQYLGLILLDFPLSCLLVETFLTSCRQHNASWISLYLFRSFLTHPDGTISNSGLLNILLGWVSPPVSSLLKWLYPISKHYIPFISWIFKIRAPPWTSQMPDQPFYLGIL